MASTPGARRWILTFRATEPLSPARQRWRERRRQEVRRLIALEKRFLPLLLSALLPILVMPFTATRGLPGQVLLALVFNLLILQSILTLPVIGVVSYARLRQEGFRWIGVVGGLGLWLPVLTGTWHGGLFRAVEMVLLSLFFLFTSIRLVRLLARVPRVNGLVMAGAAAGYLHLGLTGGVLATATQVLVPGSFSLGAAASHQVLLDRLTYFSFVTIAGVGYGDVLPANAVGERFVILLSVASTLYVALLVGLLLGRFIASEEVEMLEEDELGLHRVDGPGQP
ncbi:ion channel [Cyanobium sp. N5-Cardenillas]|uniref:ion channel n=1 Tax=Cyanobium sp. N5-Cardenillas TaxID=2823720 RepID=UPI0020CDCA45|nr:ion channel [Cyanobium sp. N5-Cardenillas]MCP9785542.1 hypothetical protein [Cyanobium sp. N5-Cardenillas]